LEPPALQLERRFLLTAWARAAHTQQAISGWMMRLMADRPIYPAAVLNNVTPASFHADETVQIALDDLGSLDVLQNWEKSLRSPYQLSAPYIARNFAIETLQPAQNRNNPG
jgi:Pvc16 N-terminal domain